MANELHLKIINQGVEWWNFWREKNSGVRPDLSKFEFKNLDLSGANFSNANFYGTEFINCNLVSSNFSGSNMIFVNFSNSKVDSANLTKVKLDNALGKKAEFSGARINNSSLTGVEFLNCIFRGAEIKKSCLFGAKLDNSNFECVNFWKSDLSVASIKCANLNQPNLSKTDLHNTYFYSSKLVHANLEGANLRNANFSEALLVGAILDRAKIKNTKLDNANLIQVYIKNPKRIEKGLQLRIETYFELASCKPSEIEKLDKDLGISDFDQLVKICMKEDAYFSKHRKVFSKVLKQTGNHWKNEKQFLEEKLRKPAQRLNQWFYVFLWFIVFCILSLLLVRIIDADDSSIIDYISMLVAIPIIYLSYTKIEMGSWHFSNSLRLMISVLYLVFMCTFLFLPIGLFFYTKNIINTLIIYLIVNIAVIFLSMLLATILSWINNTSPREELKKSRKIFPL